MRADFHALPLASRSCDLVVAAFCLYHSPRPGKVVGDIARCLAPGGVALLVTKSADSYRKLDALVVHSGLDPDALERPSLYATAHSTNLAAIAKTTLRVVHVEHEPHRFTFSSRQPPLAQRPRQTAAPPSAAG